MRVWNAAEGRGLFSPGSSFANVPANAGCVQTAAWAVAKDVTQGTGNNAFSPNDICNRAQIVTFLHRAYK